MEIKRENGQTMVEYLLLLVVAISLVTTFYKSDFVQRFLGDGKGSFGSIVKEETEFSYRHAFSRNRPAQVQEFYYGPAHPSYYNPEKSETRFFGAKEPYQ